MSSGQGGLWAKRVLIIALIGGAAAWGFINGVPQLFGETQEEGRSQLKKLTVKNFAAAIEAEDVLVVVNVEKDGSEESKTLEEFLAELERRDVYGDQVIYMEVDGDLEPELAEQMGVNSKDFRGHLGFYAGGKKLGELVGETDPQVVETQIEYHLKGLIKRIGPGWLPEVEGMTPVKPSQSVIDSKPRPQSP